MAVRVLVAGLVLLLLSGCPASPPPPATQVVGGAGYDAAHGAALLQDGSVRVVGEKGGDLLVLHLDPRGTVLSEKTFGGKGHDVGYAVTATSDGGYAVAGATASQGRGGSDFWVLKFDAADALQWERTLGGSGDDGYRDDYDAMSIAEAGDGAVVVLGNSFSQDGDVDRDGCAGTRDMVLARLDARGRPAWVKTYGGSNHEYASQVVPAAGSGFLLVGRTESHGLEGFRGEYDAWVLRLDDVGGVMWERTLGGELWDWGSAIAATPDGGALFAGYSYSSDGDAEGNQGDYDYLLVKLAADGSREWRRVLGGLVDDFAHTLIARTGGGFLVTGGSTTPGTGARGGFDFWALTLGEDGEPEGMCRRGGSGYEINGLGGSTVELRDRSFLSVGTTNSRDGDVVGNHGDYDAVLVRMEPADFVPWVAPRAGPSGPQRRPTGRGRASSPTLRAPRASHAAPAIEWQRALGGSAADRPQDAPQALAARPDGGCVVVGSTRSEDGDVTEAFGGWDTWVADLDAKGRIRWQRTLGTAGRDIGTCLAIARDGGVGVLSTRREDWSLARLDRSGRPLWERTLGGSGPEIATTLVATADGGFLAGGHTQSSDGDVSEAKCAWDWWLVKVDRRGEIEWDTTLGGSSNEYLIQVVAARDGGYLAVGRTESDDGDVTGQNGTYDYWLAKIDAEGSLEWERTYGGWDWEWGNSVAATRDGGCVLGGYTYTFSDYGEGDVTSNHGEFDYWVVKVDEEGEVEWERSLGGTHYELGYGIVQTRDGGYAMVGGSPSTDGQVTGNHGDWDLWVVRLEADGDLRWERSLGGTSYDAGYALAETPDGGLLLLGESYSTDGDVRGNHGDEDLWLVKLGGDRRGRAKATSGAGDVMAGPRGLGR